MGTQGAVRETVAPLTVHAHRCERQTPAVARTAIRSRKPASIDGPGAFETRGLA